MQDIEAVKSALSVIPADDRETWIKIGLSVKAALGEKGREVWFQWSATSQKFDKKNAFVVWKSFRPSDIGPGTLFYIARQNGWQPGADVKHVQFQNRSFPDENDERERRAKEAARQAVSVLQKCKAESHPYLGAKGFPNHCGLTFNGDLIIPIIQWPDRRIIIGYQSISPAGRKLFLPAGMSAARGVHLLGGNPFAGSKQCWWVEGFATGLSVYAALQLLYRKKDVVIVTFSVGGILRLAQHAPGFVVADHDRKDKLGRQAGIDAARSTGFPFWYPPTEGTDANDFHLEYGIESLADELRQLNATKNR